MIVPMKKAAILVQSKDAESAVKELASLGVIHVEHQEIPKGEAINTLEDDACLIDKALSVLAGAASYRRSKNVKEEKCPDWKFTAKHIVNLNERLGRLEEYFRALTIAVSEWEEWGDFDPETLAALSKKNINVRLFKIPAKEIENFPKEAVVKVLSVKGGMANCVVICRGVIKFPFRELTPPKMGVSRIKRRISEEMKMAQTLRDDICKNLCYARSLAEAKEILRKKLEFQEALSGMGKSGAIHYLTGFIPADAEKTLLAAGQEKKWGMLVKDPEPEDAVPTLIRNPRWVSVIAPVFKLIEIVPGYRELDISPVFLLFLSLFFGMIIGDAGYGALYFILAFIAQKTFAKKMKDKRIFPLLYLFSSCAIFWGIITGTVFGQEWYASAGFRPLIPILNDTKFIQAFCFFIGALHLTLAHAWQGARKLPSITALADFGWILVLWAAFFIAKMLILDDPLPFFTKWLIIAGLATVILCTSPQKNILKMVGQGLGTVALSIMNNFTDVVSYVRLFAVGLAGVAISDTVNALAYSVGGGNPLLIAIIVFHGHAINIILGPMSVLVHGIRLNVLEFSGHAGLSWSGTAYKPLEVSK